MEHKALVELIRQQPQIWDRNCPLFRDKDEKEKAWTEVAAKLKISGRSHISIQCRTAEMYVSLKNFVLIN